MKKVLICALCFIMLIVPMNGMIFADRSDESETADNTSEIKDSIKDEVALLTKAGVIALSKQYNPNSIVTRAEFASYTTAAISAAKKKDISYFTDVPLSYWASGSINALVDCKIIDKADDGRFNPDEPITYPQACKMMAAMTGYKAYADPDKIMNEYMSVAQKAGFGINTKSVDSITLAEAIKLIYNAMRTDLMSVISANGDTYTLKPEKGETVFSVYHNIKFSDGRVQSVYGKTMNSQRAESGQMYIGGEKFSVTADVDTNALFGRYVDFAYIDESDAKNIKTVIYATGRYDRDVTTVLYDDIKSFDESTRTLTYYADGDSGKERTKNAAANTVTVLNGQPYDKGIKTEIDKLIDGSRKGEVTYISGDGSSACDLICVTSYELFGADSYNSADKKFYSANKKEAIKLDDYEMYVIKDVFGSEVETDSIQSGPYMIAASDNKESLAIIVCSKKAEGTLKKITQTDRKLVIDETPYIADKAFFESNKGKFSIGSTYRVWFDLYGEIIDFVQVDSQGMKNGYITKTALVDNGFEKELMFKIYSPSDNTLGDYKLSSKIKIDEKTYKSEDYLDITAAFPENSTGNSVDIGRQVIRFQLATDGRICKIDTINHSDFEDKNNTLRRISNGMESLVYSSAVKRLGMNVYVGSNKTNIMVVPNVNESGDVIVKGNVVDDSVDLYSNSFTFTDWQTYTTDVFKYSDDSLLPDLVLVYTDRIESDYNIIMFDDVIMALANDGEIVNKLVGTSMGAEIGYEIDERLDISSLNIKKGDIISLVKNTETGKVYSITKMFDSGRKQFENNSSWTDPDRYWYGGNYSDNASGVWRGQKYQVTKGYAYDIKDSIIASSYKLSLAYEDEISEMTNCSSCKITVFDPNLNKNQIYTGKTSDILTYKTAGAECDIILTSSYNATIRQIFVIKQEK